MTLKRILCSSAAAVLSFGTAHALPTINAGGSSLAYPTYTALFHEFTTTNSGANPFSYEAVGSGAGQSAFLNNNIALFENLPMGTLTYGTIAGTSVDFGASDAPLPTGEYSTYDSSTLGKTDGPLIQVPTLGVAVAQVYNKNLFSTPTLTLTDSQVCGVLSGLITDWHSLNSAIKSGTTIEVAYRSDSSGTTFLLTQHLNKECTSSNSDTKDGFILPVPVTKTFANIFTGGIVPATFHPESGSGNVATYVAATTDAYSYLSPDYTALNPKSGNTNPLILAADLSYTVGGKATAFAPTYQNTALGLANAGAGSTNPTPPSTKTAAEDADNWVPLIPVTTNGYPFVGYTTIDLSTCYNKTSNNIASDFIKFLTDAYTSSSYTTIIENNGFVPVSNSKASPFATAIENDFLTNNSGYGLNIQNAAVCTGSVTGR
jgi:ABC-type phosphate transport system substrate-binding protein